MLSANYLPPAFVKSVAAPIAAASTPTPGTSGTTKVATPEQRAKITKTAQAYEASFLSAMLQPMFTGVDADAPFSGGAGEKAFRSFMTNAIATSMSKAGGVGLAKSVTAEMLKMQGLT
jgi:Rod binding domain-containing protein